MTKVICFANNKGGSGKSTTCASIAYAFSQEGKKVLLIVKTLNLFALLNGKICKKNKFKILRTTPCGTFRLDDSRYF